MGVLFSTLGLYEDKDKIERVLNVQTGNYYGWHQSGF